MNKNTTAMTRELAKREPPERALASGRATGKTDSADSLLKQQTAREIERAEWKRRQALQPSHGVLLSRTLPERINRLTPSEQSYLKSLIRSMKLRKIIRRTLAEAFWGGEAQTVSQHLHDSSANASMQKLREDVRARESMRSFDSVLTNFEPTYTRSTHGPGIDSPATTRALENALITLQR